MTKYDETWVAAEEAKRQWMAENGLYTDADEHSSRGVGLVVAIDGTGSVTTPDGTFEQSNRPVKFIFPGEPGFLSSQPKHGCGVAVS